jgi:hypothetical protein
MKFIGEASDAERRWPISRENSSEWQPRSSRLCDDGCRLRLPLGRDFDASQLRSLAKKTKDGPEARPLLALAAIYDGAARTEAAKIGGVGLQIIRDWVPLQRARR